MEKTWSKFINSDVIIYDLTRLSVRRNEPLATGIDRIDLAFAKGLLSEFGERVIFITKYGQDGHAIDPQKAVKMLQEIELRWLGQVKSKKESGFYQKNFGPWLCKTLSNAVRVKPRIVSELDKLLRGRSATYIVASHNGLPKISGLLANLKSSLNLQVFAYIHDLIPIRYPEYIRPAHIGHLESYLGELRSAGARLFANSRNSAEDIALYGCEIGWSMENVGVILPDPRLPSQDRAKTNYCESGDVAQNRPYFISIGTIEPRKNYLTLLQCWRYWANRNPNFVPHLHIVGQRGWQNFDIVKFLESCPAIQEHVTEHQNLNDYDLYQLLKGAKALLFPSFAEGLGIPLLEAKQAGIPMILSDISVFRDIKHPYAQFVDPIDTMAWYRACKEILP